MREDPRILAVRFHVPPATFVLLYWVHCTHPWYAAMYITLYVQCTSYRPAVHSQVILLVSFTARILWYAPMYITLYVQCTSCRPAVHSQVILLASLHTSMVRSHVHHVICPVYVLPSCCHSQVILLASLHTSMVRSHVHHVICPVYVLPSCCSFTSNSAGQCSFTARILWYAPMYITLYVQCTSCRPAVHSQVILLVSAGC
ncbi:hypothetical protein J6590_041059 [Homalodisca vitripennis]|nr:hypothetical protein J6590_041059 [Homalodisca vitripennis]